MTVRSRRSSRACAASVGLVAAMCGGCDVSTTEILVRLDTDAPPTVPVTVRAAVSADLDASPAERTWVFRSGDAALDFPASFAVLPQAGRHDGSAWIRVEATFSPPGRAPFTFHRDVGAQFIEGATVTVALMLREACGTPAEGCTGGAPCTVARRCEEQGLTCGDDARCVASRPGMDGGVPSDAEPVADVVGSPDAFVAGDGGVFDARSMDVFATMDAAPADDLPAPMDLPGPMDAGPEAAAACTGGLARCADRCADLSTDHDHCGACDRACSPGERCVAGGCACVPSCAGRVCGSDGCGGSCGACTAPNTCDGIGRCVCTPSCSGRACGDNGCGGSCGSCAAQHACSASGQCVCVTGTTACGGACCGSSELCVAGTCCPASWRTELPGVIAEGSAIAADGSVWVTGRQGVPDSFLDGDRGLVSRFDACGALLETTSFVASGTTRTNLVNVATRGAMQRLSSPPMVLGFGSAGATADLDGVATTLRTGPLAAVGSVVVRASAMDDLFWQASQAPDGNFWLASASSGTACATVSVIAPPPAAGACTFNVFADCGAADGAYSVATGHDGLAWVVGFHRGNAFAARYDTAACSASPGCSCPASSVREFGLPGFIQTAARSAAAGVSTTYVGGYAFPSGTDAVAFVAALPSSGAPVFSAPWDPSALADGFLSIAYGVGPSGPTVYAAGLRGWDGVGHTAHAQGVLAAYDAGTLARRWAIDVPGAGACWRVTIDDSGGILLTCTGLTSSSLRRCLPSGFCP